MGKEINLLELYPKTKRNINTILDELKLHNITGLYHICIILSYNVSSPGAFTMTQNRDLSCTSFGLKLSISKVRRERKYERRGVFPVGPTP